MDVEPRSSGGTPPHTSNSTYTFDYSTATYQSLYPSSRSREENVNQDVHERLECVALSLDDETPPVRSLLCPSHWGALLESTTVSFVSTMREHAWESEDKVRLRKEEEEAELAPPSGPVCVLVDRGIHTPDSMSGNGDDSKTPQGGQSPQSGMSKCQSEEQIREEEEELIEVGLRSGKQDGEREVQNVCLALGIPDDSSSLDLLQDGHIPQLVPPLPSSTSSPSGEDSSHYHHHHDHQPLLPPSHSPSHRHPAPPSSLSHLLPSALTTHSPILTSTSAAGSCRHTGLASPEVRFSSQLSITMEDSSSDYASDRVTNQSSNMSSPSQRSSLCSSTANMGTYEGDVPMFRRHYHTHSRNLSETPSLPPFYSSSTSSAYHSRNSSMGSQMSSCCFESDSLLNEMNPTLAAARTGSYNDLKHPIRLQDSRFSRLGDSSPSSYSSDLSLHRHMNKPIGVADSLLGLSPPNLEDTLRSLPVESLEERKQMATMKSSEWIKRQLSMHRDSIVQVKISSKHKHVVHFNVKAGDIIIWEFATKKKDIGFGVQFEATEVATEESEDSEPSEKEVTAILPMFRVNAHARPTVGTHTATHDGVYEIIFDNAYSRFFAKELYYRITTQPSEPNVNYLQQ